MKGYGSKPVSFGEADFGAVLYEMIKPLNVRFAKTLAKRRKYKQYLVTPSARRSNIHVCSVLRQHRGVTILNELDKSTAVVKMSDRQHDQLVRNHPELTIEPNIIFTLS